MRHYQTVAGEKQGKGDDGVSLVEIGPRFALTPIRLLGECFHGSTLFANETFVSPNAARAEAKRKRSRVTMGGVIQKERRRTRIKEGGDLLPEDELADVFNE